MGQCGVEDFDVLEPEGRWRDEIPAEVASASGPARAVLAAERTALNLLGQLSGVATLTARYVEAVRGTRAQILDTRKTTPGLRALERLAVAAGGGVNHRSGLYDAILIKENHIAMAGGIEASISAARGGSPAMLVEIECRDLDEVRAALGAGAERILLDNMAPAAVREAVTLRDEAGQAANGTAGASVALEASGGVTLKTVREIAETGVDYISVGALTHSAPALDVSMLIEPITT
jgi:nicotinate-nucleotide pyrophosphorylase (carboxylating)